MYEFTKLIVEKNYSVLLWACTLSLFGILSLPNAFFSVEEEHLVTLRGQVTDLFTHHGVTPAKNTFTFTINEYPGMTFEVGGIRYVDQLLLTNTETIGNLFTFSVSEEEFSERKNPIHVYDLSTYRNTYLKSDHKALGAVKERYLAVSLSLLSLMAAVWLLLDIKKRFNPAEAQDTPLEIDSLLTATIRHPRVAVAGYFFTFFLLLCIPLPRQAPPYLFAISACGYLGFLFWFYSSGSQHPWYLSLVARDQEKRMHLATRLVTAAPKHVKAVQLLLKKGAFVDIRDQKGRTPLLIASEAGQVEAVGLLLKNKANVNMPDLEGNTPLMAASARNHLGVVMALLKSGAQVNLFNQLGSAALDLALANKVNPAILEILTRASQKEKEEEKKAAEKREKKAKEEEEKKKQKAA